MPVKAPHLAHPTPLPNTTQPTEASALPPAGSDVGRASSSPATRGRRVPGQGTVPERVKPLFPGKGPGSAPLSPGMGRAARGRGRGRPPLRGRGGGGRGRGPLPPDPAVAIASDICLLNPDALLNNGWEARIDPNSSRLFFVHVQSRSTCCSLPPEVLASVVQNQREPG